MRTEPAAADPASVWMTHLERAHDRAHAAARSIEDHAEPSAHLAPAARRIEHGLAAMYDAFDGRADRPTAIGVAHARLWDAAILVARAGLPGALVALREACAELVAAERRFPRVPLAGRAAVELQAGSTLPPLHTIERASLMPSFRAPPVPEPEGEAAVIELPEPTTFEELAAVAERARRMAQERAQALAGRLKAPPAVKAKVEAPVEVPSGFAFAPPPPLDEGAFVRRWARECFDEIGMLGLQRAPLPGDDWRACQALETRLINAIDALAALGPIAMAHVEPMAMDAPVANPMSMFAVAMIGGCIEGRDALAGAERVLHRFGPNDPAVAEAFAAAMKLAPNPFVRSVLRSLYASAEFGCRAIAVEVLAHRGWLEPDDLAALAEEQEPRILALALPALAAARHPALERALGRALAQGDTHLQAAALDATALAAHPRAAAAARAAADGALGDRALVRLAIAGGENDARWLLGRMQEKTTPAAVEAVGWAGWVGAVPALLQLLEAEDKETKLAAGAALDRLLGANLVDLIEVMPEALATVDVVDPDPESPRRRESLAALVSHPRDQPPAGSAETLEVPSTDPARWRAYWAAYADRHPPRLRVRRGQAYSPSVSLYELDRLSASPEDRRRLHRELAARTGKLTPFDPFDFVHTQERSLETWASFVRASAETPGSWGRPNVR
ncbi:hypothetical protein WMF28_10085 [Sorangium sp. So ce590]|uniref:hypothetical protein n=1 Tax=Sorangium sp. So ce590 TaxID=3133317 RepID=UPI003F5DF110